MPIYKATVTAPTQFDGLTEATGLFDPAKNTGNTAIQVRVNSASFSGASALTSWTFSLVDPSDSQSTGLLTGTSKEFAVGGPAGFMQLPTNDGGVPWHLTLVTVGMVGTGVFAVDSDFNLTEG